MRRTCLHRNATTLEILDRVLGKGIVVEMPPDGDASRRQRSIAGIGLLGVDAHVEVVTDIDIDETVRRGSGA